MKIKKYRADSIKNALQKVRDELGGDAVILKTKKVPQDGLMGVVGKTEVEVTAAIDYDLDKNKSVKVKAPSNKKKKMDKLINKNKKNVSKHKFSKNYDNINNFKESNKGKPLSKKKNNIKINNNNYKESNDNFQKIEDEIYSLKKDFENLKSTILLKNKIDLKGIYKDIFIELINNDVEEHIAYQILDKVKNRTNASQSKNEIYNEIKNILKDLINISKGISVKHKGYVVAFIGPTCVGKTTTLSKLAANAVIYQEKNVGIMSVDTYRLGAVEQLKSFTNILNLDLKIAMEKNDISKILDDYSKKDIIFIDTIGRSPGDVRTMERLGSYLKMIKPDEVYLVLSATSKIKDIYETIKKFNVHKIDKLIFTKLDETTTYGFLLSVGINVKRPLAYLTNGQSIPEDIFAANSRYLINKILRRDNG